MALTSASSRSVSSRDSLRRRSTSTRANKGPPAADVCTERPPSSRNDHAFLSSGSAMAVTMPGAAMGRLLRGGRRGAEDSGSPTRRWGARKRGRQKLQAAADCCGSSPASAKQGCHDPDNDCDHDKRDQEPFGSRRNDTCVLAIWVANCTRQANYELLHCLGSNPSQLCQG